MPERGLAIDPVDPHGVEFDDFYDVYLAAERALGEAASPWMREEVRVSLQDPGSVRWLGAFAGRVDGRVAVVGQLSTPLLDNRESATLAIHVDPAYSRRGLGSTMLERLEREARDRGRRLLNAEAVWDWPAGPQGEGAAGPDFARSRGYRLGLTDIKSRLALPVADDVLDALAAEAAEHHAGYTLRTFSGPVPDDLVDGWARLTGSLMTEAPTGEVERESENVDATVVREGEALLARQGRRKYNTVAIDPHGEVVAFTDIATTVHEPGRAYQWGTLVRSDARGHRLGVAVKVANLRLLQAERPDVTLLTTYNAEVNRPMLAVNERLGFAPVAWLGELQKVLGRDG